MADNIDILHVTLNEESIIEQQQQENSNFNIKTDSDTTKETVEIESDNAALQSVEIGKKHLLLASENKSSINIYLHEENEVVSEKNESDDNINNVSLEHKCSLNLANESVPKHFQLGGISGKELLLASDNKSAININLNEEKEVVSENNESDDHINNESLERKWMLNLANESVAKHLQLVKSGKKELLLASEHKSAISKFNNLLENQILITENKSTIEKDTLNENVNNTVDNTILSSSLLTNDHHLHHRAEDQEIVNKNDKNINDNMQDVRTESSVNVMPDAIVDGQFLKTINKNEAESLPNDDESENIKFVMGRMNIVCDDSSEGKSDNQQTPEDILLLISNINNKITNKNINDNKEIIIETQSKSSPLFMDAQYLQDDSNFLFENEVFENIEDVKKTLNESDEPPVKLSKYGVQLIEENEQVCVIQNQDIETITTRSISTSTDDAYENCGTNNINSEEILQNNENNSVSCVNVSVQTDSIESSLYSNLFIYWIINIVYIIFIVFITIMFVGHQLIPSHIFDCPSISNNSNNSNNSGIAVAEITIL